jgi:hypothetical protein
MAVFICINCSQGKQGVVVDSGRSGLLLCDVLSLRTPISTGSGFDFAIPFKVITQVRADPVSSVLETGQKRESG